MKSHTQNIFPTTAVAVTPERLWSAAKTLSPRIKKLRDQYWSFFEREYTNEVRSFTTSPALSMQPSGE